MTNDIRITGQRKRRVFLSEIIAIALCVAVIVYIVWTAALALIESNEALLSLGYAKTARLAVVSIGKKYYSNGESISDPTEPSGLRRDAYDEAVALSECDGSIGVLAFDSTGTKPLVFYYTEGEYTVVCAHSGSDADAAPSTGDWTVYRSKIVISPEY